MTITTHIEFTDAQLWRGHDLLQGFCIKCGHEHGPCEPDTREQTCQECGEASVFGAQEIGICVRYVPRETEMSNSDDDQDKPQPRYAPEWAWDILLETLSMDTESKAFSLDLREDIKRALATVSMEAE